MLFRSAAAVIAIFASSAQAAGSLDYDYEDFRAWNDFTGSACNGLKNSPVAVKTTECTRYENYAMTVSTFSINLVFSAFSMLCHSKPVLNSCFVHSFHRTEIVNLLLPRLPS